MNWSKYENQSSLLSRHFMLWLYNGSFYLTDDGAENSQSAVHSGPVGFDNYFHNFVNYRGFLPYANFISVFFLKLLKYLRYANFGLLI